MKKLNLGQVWVCGAVGATPPLVCIIGRIDRFASTAKGSRIVSLLVTPNLESKKRGWPIVGHMPVYEKAFYASDIQLSQINADLGDEFESGYTIWRTAFEAGRAGVFSLNVSEAYTAIVSIKNQH